MNTFTRILLAFLGGITIAVLTFVAAAAGHRYQHVGRIFPGISVGGVDLSGLTMDEAAGRLVNEIDYASSARIAFQDGGSVWTASPSELGYVLNVTESVNAAYAIGRTENASFALTSYFQPVPIDLPPRFTYDERVAYQFLETIADQIDVPTVEATLGLNGLEVVLHSGQVGRELDIRATLYSVPQHLQALQDGLVDLQVIETPPVIFDASEQAEVARKILSAPLVIFDPDAPADSPVEWVIEPEILAGMLSIERVKQEDGSEAYQIGIRTADLVPFLESLAPGLSKSPRNARFIFNDDTRELDLLEPSVTGRQLLVKETAERINRKLGEGDHRIKLDFDYIEPLARSDSTAEELGISELVIAQTSYFYGSSASRAQNIKVAASRFHGYLIAPGETFSMADVLGDVSLDTGFSEALIIFGDRTIKGVGGGVCQVSTTLFRTAFFGGYPVNERYSHAYRVYYYELAANGTVNTSLAGLDATVYVPLVDFKFTNDTPYWLLMETYIYGQTLTWKFYSTADGRTVSWETSGLKNKVEPPEPLYEENAELKKGEIKQVDWEVEGADVTVRRTVYRNGGVYFEDVFTTHYAPWRAVYQYGPGTELPDDAKDAW